MFKKIFKPLKNFHNKNTLYSSYKKVWVVDSFFPIIEKTIILNTRKKAIKLPPIVLAYTTIHHNLLIKVLSEIMHTALESKVCSKIGFSAISIYCTSEKILIEAITFLIKNCYFTIGNIVFKQKFGIPMGIDPATF